MKTKFTITILALFLAAASPIPIKEEKAKPTPSTTADSVKNIEDVKTFNFQKIFAEADEYYNAAEKWEQIKCTPQSGFVCTKRLCEKLKILDSAYMILNKKNKSLALCKYKACRYYPAEFVQSGVFISIRIEDSNGIYVRVLGDSRYKEISMIGLDAYVTNGNCEVMAGDAKVE